MLKHNLLVVLAAAVFFAGCGASGPRTAPVSGTVSYKGKPVAGASVSFVPEDPTGRIATGVTDSDGHFKLGTLSADDGAIAGKYRVTVIARGPDRPAKPGEGSGMPGETVPGEPLIPAKYFSPDTSGLVQEVKPGKNTVALKLD